ncbi:MAG: SusC/RagA family TonB-linked outer membrane protein [Candidatus Cryptobacteroides sp.]
MRNSDISPVKVLFNFFTLVVILLTIGQGVAFAADIPDGQKKTVTGRVVDSNGEPVLGAAVMVEGTTDGMLVDEQGGFSIKVSEGQNIVATLIGYQDKRVRITDKSVYLIVMEEESTALEDAMVVAFSKQKKESVVSSIATIRPAELKVPSSNLTTALGGRIAGMITQQLSGEPGQDNAEFFIRGVTTFNSNARGPLILIDNVELSSTDLARLQPDDIASFSVLKDATATALYGARGANGVILVTTKEGKEGRASLNIRFENSFSMPTSVVEVVDPVTWMTLYNEAVSTRDPLAPRPFSDKKIELTKRGVNKYAYPSVDWIGEMFKDYTTNQRVNANLSGGGKVARYYIAATFNNDTGLLKENNSNSFNNNISLRTTQLRSNININVTSTTELSVRFSGTFEDYTGPLDGGSELYRMALASDPVSFPMYYEGALSGGSNTHIMFGNTSDGNYLNPYARMVRGYKEYSKLNLIAQVELKQKLDFITKGLSARALFNTTRYSYFDLQRYYNPYWYTMTSYDVADNAYTINCINPDGGTEYLDYSQGGKDIQTTTYLEAAIDYNRKFKNKHDVSGLLVYTMQNKLYASMGDLQSSLPYRNLGFAGRFTYGYDSRYLIEANFGYNGSERFAKGERFGFFPSVGAGYIISNEKFFGPKLKKVITLLKLKATYGLAGNDQIGSSLDRFFYLSNVNMNAGLDVDFGDEFAFKKSGVTISRYPNDKITWEVAKKFDVGVELGLWDWLTVQADYYREKRTNILMDRQSIPSTMGLQAPLRANVGEASSHGYEISLDANKSFAGGSWISGRFNMTYATGKYDVYEEPDYGYEWLSWKGKRLNQITGLIAERLFIDEADIANSPQQMFGDVMPGDIKYKDINEDGIINGQDYVPIGYPSIPNYIFGFGVSAGFKNFDVSCFFQAATECSFMINHERTAPFVNLGDWGSVTSNAMMKEFADNRWTESNRDCYAMYPRLSPQIVSNNNKASTWWLRDGSYLRLKTLEIGYTIPKKACDAMRMKTFRIYFSGTNLFTLSKFKMWDVEMSGNGLNYPIQRVFNLGLNVNF